jgi:hypothetical protein
MGPHDQIRDGSNLEGLIDAAVQIARKRRETLQRLRTAVLDSDTTEVYKYARELCGLENDKLPPPGLGRPVRPRPIRTDIGSATPSGGIFGEATEGKSQ